VAVIVVAVTGRIFKRRRGSRHRYTKGTNMIMNNRAGK